MKRPMMMRWAARAAAASFVLGVAYLAAPVLAGTPCYERRATSWTQYGPPGGGCATYTNCPDRYLCLEGTIYLTSGTIVLVTIDCDTYQNGTWDPVKKACVGGTKITSQQSVTIYDQNCSGTCN